jgi:hypothetical protein
MVTWCEEQVRTFLAALIQVAVLAGCDMAQKPEWTGAYTMPAKPAAAPTPAAPADEEIANVGAAGYHVMCASNKHSGIWCKNYKTLPEADAGLAKHRKETGHTDNGRSAGKCPYAEVEG